MAQRKATTRSGPEKKQGAGCLIWLVALLVTLLLFVFSWDEIKETMESTGFSKVISTPGGEPSATPGTGDGSLEPAPEPPVATPVTIVPPPEPATNVQVPESDPKQPADSKPADSKPAGTVGVRPASPAVSIPQSTPMEQVKATRVAVLYFIRVDDDGIITRHEVKRTVGASDSPMTDALEALMSGPNADELARGFISLIPSGTKLLSATVRGSTAYLDFNEAFMYNRYGIEGYAGQLKQIVYTATGYSTVKDVQILIDGQKRDYLGGDGVFIGKPLSRASF